VSYLAAYLNRDGEKLNGVAATLAGALVITFPFLSQSIANVAQGFYFYIAAVFSACFVAFIRYRQTAKLHWAIITVIIGVLAPAVHENLIVIGALLGIWLIVDRDQNKAQSKMSFRGASRAERDAFRAQARDTTRNLLDQSQRFLASLGMTSLWSIPFLVTLGNVLWLLLWLQIPKLKGDGLGWVGWTSLIQSKAFFLQGLTFPIQPLARVMMEYGWGDVAATLTLGVIGLILLSAVLIARGKWRILVIGLTWYAFNAAPMVLGLGFHYMISNMRFLVSPVPAVALLWATFVVTLFKRPLQSPEEAQSRDAGLVATSHPSTSFLAPMRLVTPLRVLVVLFILLPSSFIISESMQLHSMSLNSVHDLREIVKANPTQKHLIINPIDWIASNQPRYAMGHETVQILPGYLMLRGLAYTNTGVWANIDGVVFDNIKPELKNHWYSLAADSQNVDWEGMATRVPNYDRVWLTRYSDEQVDIVEAGKVESNAPITFASHIASFDEKILLVSAQANVVKNEMQLTLSWQVMNPTQGEVFRHVLDCEGNVLGLGDGPALGGVYPLWLWRTGDRITDARFIPLEKLSSCYRIEIGLYNPQNGERLKALDANQKRFENDVVVIEKR
jgi:hypothetical protein